VWGPSTVSTLSIQILVSKHLSISITKAPWRQQGKELGMEKKEWGRKGEGTQIETVLNDETWLLEYKSYFTKEHQRDGAIISAFQWSKLHWNKLYNHMVLLIPFHVRNSKNFKPHVVAHTSNSSYWGGRDRKIRSSRPAWEKLGRPFLRNKNK
jgi:hypothetical protein